MSEEEADTHFQGPQTLEEFIADELEFAKEQAIRDANNINANIKMVELNDTARTHQPGLRSLMINSAVYQKRVEEAQEALSNSNTESAIEILNAKIAELNQLVQSNHAVGAKKDGDAYLVQLNQLVKLKNNIS